MRVSGVKISAGMAAYHAAAYGHLRYGKASYRVNAAKTIYSLRRISHGGMLS